MDGRSSEVSMSVTVYGPVIEPDRSSRDTNRDTTRDTKVSREVFEISQNGSEADEVQLINIEQRIIGQFANLNDESRPVKKDEIVRVASLLIKNEPILVLHVHSKDFLNDHSVEAAFLCHAIKVNKTLTNVWLSPNIGNSSAELISQALVRNNNLTTLILQDNMNLGAKGIEALARGLRVNQTLRYLNIDNTCENAKDLRPLIEILPSNRGLAMLGLVTSQFDHELLGELKEALWLNRTLMNVSLCTENQTFYLPHLSKILVDNPNTEFYLKRMESYLVRNQKYQSFWEQASIFIAYAKANRKIKGSKLAFLPLFDIIAKFINDPPLFPTAVRWDLHPLNVKKLVETQYFTASLCGSPREKRSARSKSLKRPAELSPIPEHLKVVQKPLQNPYMVEAPKKENSGCCTIL